MATLSLGIGPRVSVIVSTAAVTGVVAVHTALVSTAPWLTGKGHSVHRVVLAIRSTVHVHRL